MQNYIQAQRLEATVVMTGPVARREVPQYITAMDIAVQPAATAYACPMKIPEYMGMAKCILAPDQPNIREILEHGVTAFLFSPKNKNTLRTALLHLIDDSVARKNMGNMAYQRLFERGFFWQNNAKRALRFVNEAKHLPSSSAVILSRLKSLAV